MLHSDTRTRTTLDELVFRLNMRTELKAFLPCMTAGSSEVKMKRCAVFPLFINNAKPVLFFQVQS